MGCNGEGLSLLPRIGSREDTMRRITVLISLVLLFTGLTQRGYAYQEMQKQLQFDLFSLGTEHRYLGKLMVFVGPVGIGTAYHLYADKPQGAGNICWEYTEGLILNDTLYMATVTPGHPNSYFPLIIHYILYSKTWLRGNIRLYGYFNGSTWSRERIGSRPFFKEYKLSDYNVIFAAFTPYAWLKIGFGVSLNPLKYIPLDLRINYLRMYYHDYLVPEPYRQLIHRTLSTRYFRFMLILRYQMSM